MKASDNCVNLVKEFEGFSPTPYKDGAGFNSIGFGHKIQPGELFESISEETAEALLRDDLREAEKAVNDLVTVPLNQNQYDALCSLVFNAGIAPLKSGLGKMLNLSNYQGCSQHFLLWDHMTVNGVLVQSDGLLRRREAERALFDKPD